jgi:hypothetical protein
LADVNARDHFGFGGRRICPGLHIAERSVVINLARLLWGFNIDLAKDGNGDIIPVDFTTDGLVPGAMSNAKPFECCISSLCGTDVSYYCEESEAGEDYEGGVGSGTEGGG